ncbi:hypothetical protein Pmani_005582 [Petrolisthes manimaculis]|uniref:Uncharacterized protein n=1 Tax=Petrolisthes manimaculis TaxID=1843537 RepID=A0AAE1UHC6_9EUCA|nr:hypothetical protein Pmani_005582 [Petrolisthes manimaculis]
MLGHDEWHQHQQAALYDLVKENSWYTRFFSCKDQLRTHHDNMKLRQELEGGSSMGGSSQYCLRWNNHRNNLLAAFDQLLHMEALTDVTLACEDGVTLHAHRLVLAACSSYFQALFVCARAANHPIVVLKDVRAGDMRALLQYMYRGEVNVNHDDLPALLGLAETLKVKGLVEELATDTGRRPLSPPPRDPTRPPTAPLDARTHRDVTRPRPDPSSASVPPNSLATTDLSRPSSPPGPLYPPHQPLSRPQLRPELRDPRDVLEGRDLRDLREHLWDHLRDPRDQPESRDSHTPGSQDSEPRCGGPLSLVPHIPHLPPHCPDSPPHKRKRPHMLPDPMLSPTPILRTALGHSHAFPGPDMSSLVSLASSMMPLPGLLSSHAPHLLAHDHRDHLEGQYGVTKKELHDEESMPFTDITRNDDHDNKIKMEPVPNGPLLPDFNPYHLDPNGSSHFSNFVSYVPTPKPEWKRYKQYTKTDLMDAIEAVKNGMTALQASRKYKVPSRTLYDKIKKMGISTLPRRLPNKKPSPSNTELETGVGGGMGIGIGGLIGGGGGGQGIQDTQPQHQIPVSTQDSTDSQQQQQQTHSDREPPQYQLQLQQQQQELIDKIRLVKVLPSCDDDHHHSNSGPPPPSSAPSAAAPPPPAVVVDDEDESSSPSAPNATPAVGSFSLVGRKLYENGGGGGVRAGGSDNPTAPLDLTDSDSLLPKRPQIEEKA